MNDIDRRRPARSGPNWPALGVLVLFLAALGVFVWWRSQAAPRVPELGGATPSAALQGIERDLLYAGQPIPLPGRDEPVTVLKNTGYIAGYSESRKDPLWVSYCLFKVDNPGTYPRPTRFEPDQRTASRVRHEDYNYATFESLHLDRGHMAPNHAIAICYGHDAQLETFLTSNICPQAHNCNAGPWEKLERDELETYAPRFGKIWVIDGPIFDAHPPALSAGVQIPRAFYKIILEEQEGEPHVRAVIMPQTTPIADTPSRYTTTVQEIETESGWEFFPQLDPVVRHRLETESSARLW